MLRYHQLGSVLSGPINSKPTFFPQILLLQMRPWHDKKANRRDKGTIGAKKCPQKMLCPTPVEVQKLIFMIKMDCVYIQNYASCVSADYIFIKVLKQSRQKMKNGAKRR